MPTEKTRKKRIPPTQEEKELFKQFREKFFEKFDFIKGFIMDASNFADVKSWGLSFSVFNSKKVIVI